MRFSEIQHQPRALGLLRRALQSDRAHHAYLLAGPDGIGKELTGRALAARLLCESQSVDAAGDACGECRSCRLFASGNHPDFHLIHRGLHRQHPDRNIRESRGLFLVIDVIRHFLIAPANTTPSLGRRRIFLIRDAERMNEGAQNAMLKTLEEPPASACLILVTSSAERLLPTIRSRCQRVQFDLLPAAFVEQRLRETASLDAQTAHTLVNLSQGRLGAALDWHQAGLLASLDRIDETMRCGLWSDPEAFGKMLVEVATEFATRARGIDDAATQETTSTRKSGQTVETSELRAGLKLILMLVATILRDALAVRAAGAALRCLPDCYTAADQLAASRDEDALADGIDAIREAESALDRNVAPQLVCECLAITLDGITAPI